MPIGWNLGTRLSCSSTREERLSPKVQAIVLPIRAVRAGRWANSGRATLATGLALTVLICSRIAIAQLLRSLILLIVGIVTFDFSVQIVHVNNRHALTAAYPDRLNTVIGSYMVFYSLGSALSAARTTTIFNSYGWTGPCLITAGFAILALVVWAINKIRKPNRI